LVGPSRWIRFSAFVLSAARSISTPFGPDLHEVFDLSGGTSTGGIIALGIGTPASNGGPYRPAELVDLYVSRGPEIFPKGILSFAKTSPAGKWVSRQL